MVSNFCVALHGGGGGGGVYNFYSNVNLDVLKMFLYSFTVNEVWEIMKSVMWLNVTKLIGQGIEVFRPIWLELMFFYTKSGF